jgi:hypothetical protein
LASSSVDAVRVTPAASVVVLASSAAFCAASISVKTISKKER